jgi:exonuclease III
LPFVEKKLGFFEKFPAFYVLILDDNNDRIIAIEVKCRGKTFDVACIYWAPRREQQHVNTILDKLDEFLTNLRNDSILVGDYNFDLNNTNAIV